MPELPILNTATLWDILNGVLSDQTVNRLVWQALGYRYDPSNECWDITEVPADWIEAYPQPPDFMGSRPATVKLTRSIPAAHKQLLKEELGFTGYKVGELNPTLTRRATAANWLLSYMKARESQI
jgi:hypothetical protein